MQIDWVNFTPWTALFGGILIGLASGGLILLVGRIAGISGILGDLISSPSKPHNDRTWRLLFLLGLICAPLLWSLFAPLPITKVLSTTPTLIIAGLLVGLGTRYANGCTSGHGICGLARLSPRSLIAVISFMTSGFVTVYLIRHIF